jgi:hypothetical protein
MGHPTRRFCAWARSGNWRRIGIVMRIGVGNACWDWGNAREWARGVGRWDLAGCGFDLGTWEDFVSENNNNQMPEQKSSLVIRVPLSADGYASIYFSSNDGRVMTEREWWHLRQVVELASKAFVKPEDRAMAANA